MSQAANTNEDRWISKFDKGISDWEDGSVEEGIAIMLKDFLLSNGITTANSMAHQIDTFYKQYLESDPLMKYEDDQGMEGFLSGFYDVVFTLAKFIPYNSTKQDNLVQLILELRQLPSRKIKLWKQDCLVWIREPVSAMSMEDYWNGNHPSDTKESDSRDCVLSFDEICDEWLNFSSFLARWIQAGLSDDYEDCFKYPGLDIPEGLEQDLLLGPKRDCKVMVAAQYILLAGRAIESYCFDTAAAASGFGPQRWKRWAERFANISSDEENKGDLREAADRAHNFMVSVHPELYRSFSS